MAKETPLFSLSDVHTDTWVWGNERIVWGYDPDHPYTLKILEPKPGRDGVLSLQYHDRKSETWICHRGIAWALLSVDGVVCTRLMRSGDIQVIAPKMIHRLGAVTADVQVIEPSTPDAHAANKATPKDVVRLHCVFGRSVTPPRSPAEATLVEECIRVTEEAIACVEKGVMPPEYNLDKLKGRGAHRL